MEFYEVMHTTFACREFTGEPAPEDVLHRIIYNAHFAPSGGNRQPVEDIFYSGSWSRV